MTTSVRTAFSSRPSPSSAVSELLSKNHSDASEQSGVTAATSGSTSSADVDKYQHTFDSPGEKKLAQTPPLQCHETGESRTSLNRESSGSLPDLRKTQDESEESSSTFDMSDFGCADFYHTSDLRHSDRKPLPDVPEEADIATPPSSLDPALVYPAHTMNIIVSPPSRGISPSMAGSMASSTSTVQSMELHTHQPLLYSAIGSLEKSPSAMSNTVRKSSGREFRTSDASLLIPPAKTKKPKKSMEALAEKPAPRTKRQDGKSTQSERPASILHKSNRDTNGSSLSRVKISEPKKSKSKKAKKVSISNQTEEKFLPVSEAFTPREKKNIKYKPAEMRTPVQKIGMGTLARPNFRDALRRVAMIIRQHIEKIEHRFENPSQGANLFSPLMKDMFSDEQFVTPRYKCTMVRVPMARPGTVYGLRKIRLNFSLPTEEEIYEFGHQLFDSVQLSSECSIVCLIYVERLMEVAKVPLLSSTWRPIFMCGLLLASKVWQDLASWNIEFASVYPQYSLDAINRLELNFLRMVKWDLYISSRYVGVLCFSGCIMEMLRAVIHMHPFSLASPHYHSLYAKYYFALRSLVEKQDFRQRYNRMVGGVDNVAASEALKVQKRTELVKEEALMQLSRSM